MDNKKTIKPFYSAPFIFIICGLTTMFIFTRKVILLLIFSNLFWGLSVATGIFNIILIWRYGPNRKIVFFQIICILVALLLMLFVLLQPYLLKLIYPYKV